jgi:hypothetical protein
MADREATAHPPHRRRPPAWLLPFVGFFLLFAAWALATPYDGTPDEMRHIERAYGVGSGDVAPEPVARGKVAGAVQQVPGSLVRTNCFAFHPDVPASCGRPLGGDETKVPVVTAAGRYNPVYYLVVGWPLVVAPDMTGVLAARLLSAALVAGLFGAAVAVAGGLRRRGVVAGLVVALTPMTAHMSGAVNPNAIEIAAGAALVVALIAVLFEPDGSGGRRAPWWLAGISAAVLITVRPAGPAWFAVIAAVLLIPLTRARYLALLRSRRVWILSSLLVVIAAAAAGWTLWKRANQLTPNRPPRPGLGFLDGMKIEFFDQWRRHTSEMVGVLSWLDTPLPVVVQLAWWSSVGTLVFLALALGGPVARWRVAGLAALGMLVPSAVEAYNAHHYGFIGQGRYYLPMLVGVPIIAAYVVAGRFGGDLTTRLARLFAIILLPLQVGALCYTMVRYQQGLPRVATPSLNPFAGSWHPVVGSVLPVLLAVAAGAAIFVTVRLATAVAPAGRTDETTSGTAHLDETTLPEAADGPRLREKRPY